MFIDAMGLIMADTKRISLGELSKPRALAAVPFGGRYRIVDFILSGLVNSGVKSVALIAQNKYMSLMDHLGTGAPWDLDRKSYGLSILPPHVNAEFAGNPDSDELWGMLNFVRQSPHKYVIIVHSNVVFNMTFNDIIKEHIKSDADVTVMFNRDGNKGASPNYIFEVDRKGYLKELFLDPEKPKSNRASMGVMVLGKEKMVDILTEAIAREEKNFDLRLFLRHSDPLKIKTYGYNGLAFRIQNVQTYFNASMELLNEKTRKELFWNGIPIFTKVKDEAPTLFSDTANVSNSIISDGCRIMGSVENSILFRGITISEKSRVKNSIIMQDVLISDHCELENVIVDKDSVIRPGMKLVGHKDYPVVIGKGAIV